MLSPLLKRPNASALSFLWHSSLKKRVSGEVCIHSRPVRAASNMDKFLAKKRPAGDMVTEAVGKNDTKKVVCTDHCRRADWQGKVLNALRAFRYVRCCKVSTGSQQQVWPRSPQVHLHPYTQKAKLVQIRCTLWSQQQLQVQMMTPGRIVWCLASPSPARTTCAVKYCKEAICLATSHRSFLGTGHYTTHWCGRLLL